MLKKFILLEEKSNTQGIKKQKQKHEEKNFEIQKSVIKNALMLYVKELLSLMHSWINLSILKM